MKSISVIIPFYNNQRYLYEAVNSLKQQDYKDFEVILVNNASQDNSLKIARKAAAGDSRFKIFYQGEQGIDKALNLGVSKAKGEIISFLDADDLYLPSRLEIMLSVMESNHADLIACRGRKIAADGRELGEEDPYFFSEQDLPFIFFQRNFVVSLSLMMIKKEKLRMLLPFSNQYNRMLDYYLILQSIINHFKIILINDILVEKRYHGENLSLDLFEMEKQVFPALIDFYNHYQPLKGFYSRGEIKSNFTKRYMQAVQYKRRRGEYDEIPGYLEQYYRLGFIKKPFYIYFNAAAYFKSDFQRFQTYLSENRINHAFYYFLKGIYFVHEGNHKAAVSYFEKAYIKSMQNFPEALNSLALSYLSFDRKESIAVLNYLVRKEPEYRDALRNLGIIINERKDPLHHTYFFTPKTFKYFLNLK